MIHKSQLIEGRFIKRYKRFFADVEVDGTVVVAHVPNTGSMKTCMEENATCYLTHNPDPKRKLQWTLERVVMGSSHVGVNTGIPNNLVLEAWENKIVPHWKDYDQAQKEVKINSESRLDMALWKSEDYPKLKKITADVLTDLLSEKSKKIKNKSLSIHFIEIKNVTMAIGNVALFPDAVTSRGAKHIEELMTLMDQGHTCEMVFVIQRENIESFEIAEKIDPNYGKVLAEAVSKGLKVTALKVDFSENETKIVGLL